MLIAATAILITVMPALRRSLERARPSQPRVSRGPVPSEHPEGPVLVVEAPPQRHVPPGGSDEEDPLLRPEGERPVPGRREGPSPGFPRWARERQNARQSGATALDDEAEVERLVREQLYGFRDRPR